MFSVFAIMIKSAIDICIQVFVYQFSFLFGKISEGGIARLLDFSCCYN